MQSLYVIVQGPDHSPALYDVRVTRFLSAFNRTLESLAVEPEEDGGRAQSAWDSMTAAMALAKRRKPLTMSEASALMWNEIEGRTFRFERRREEVDVLEGGFVAMADVLAVYNGRVLDLDGGASRLSVQMFGAGREFETPLAAWERDAKENPADAGSMPVASAGVSNVTDADPINRYLL